MGLFRKDDQDPSGRPKNPDTYFMFKLLGAGYLLYLVWDMIKLYRAGGEDQPSIWLMVLAVAVLGGGAIFIIIVSYRMWRRHKQEEAEEALLAQQALEEEVQEDPNEEELPEDQTSQQEE